MGSAFLQFVSRRVGLRLSALVVAVVCGLAAVDLQASCGDYLHVGSARQAQQSMQQHHAANSAPNAPVAPQPCHGPNCRRQIPLNVPPAPVPPQHRVELAGLCNLEDLYRTEHSDIAFLVAYYSVEEGYPLLLKRPPRS